MDVSYVFIALVINIAGKSMCTVFVACIQGVTGGTDQTSGGCFLC